MKKVIGAIILLGALAATAVIYFKPFNTSEVNVNPFEAIPSSVVLVVQTNNYSNLIQQIDSLNYRENFNSSPWFSLIQKQIETVSTILYPNDSLSSTLIANNSLVGLANAGSGEVAALFIVNTDNKVSIVQPTFVSSYNYNGSEIQEFQSADLKFFGVKYNNLLIASVQASLVEEALNQVKGNNEKDTQLLALAAETKTNSHFQLFLHYADFDKLASTFTTQNSFQLFDNIDKLGDWGGYEVSLSKDQVHFSGKINYSDPSILSNLSNSFPGPNSLTDYLPANVSYFNNIYLEDNAIFKTDDSNLAYWFSWLNQNYCHFVLETFNENYEDRAGLILNSSDSEIALANIEEWYGGPVPIEDSLYQNYIYRLDDAAILNLAFPNGMVVFDKAYFAIYKDVVVLAPQMNTIQIFLQKNKEGNTLDRDIEFADFNDKISSKSNMHFYCEPYRMAKVVDRIFKDEFIQPKSINKVSIQYSNIKGAFLANGIISYESVAVDKTTKLWDATLATPASKSVQQVTNGKDVSSDLITQDQDNTVYLFNSSGELQFSLPLDEPVLGVFNQIDYYKNGNLQYVFNTESKVYLVDRLGRSVLDFPRELPVKASGPVLVVNYDNNRNYRYFISGDNGNIYGYEADFKPLDGWNPKASVGVFSKGMSHKMIGVKDYIYGVNDDGQFHAFNRKGDARFEAVNTGNTFNQNFEALKDGFINGANGNLHKVALDGVSSVVQVEDSTMNHFQSLKNKTDLLTANAWYGDNEFKLSVTEIEEIAAYSTDEPIDFMEIHSLNNEIWILLYADGVNYLVDQTGGLHPDFPIVSTVPVSFLKLYENKEPVLIISDDLNKINAYEIKFPN